VLVLAMSQVAVVLSGGGGGGGEYQYTPAQVVPVVAKYGSTCSGAHGLCNHTPEGLMPSRNVFPATRGTFNSRDTTNCHWGTLQSIVCKGAVHSVVSLAGTA
jgi:hypothetical protein